MNLKTFISVVLLQLSLLLLIGTSYGQNGDVSSLPPTASSTGQVYLVVDSTGGSCTTGGGTVVVLCQSNGTTWSAVNLSAATGLIGKNLVTDFAADPTGVTNAATAVSNVNGDAATNTYGNRITGAYFVNIGNAVELGPNAENALVGPNTYRSNTNKRVFTGPPSALTVYDDDLLEVNGVVK